MARSIPFQSSSRPLTVASWILAIVIAGSALSLGSLHTSWLAAWTALAVVAAVLAHMGSPLTPLRPSARILFTVGLVLVAYTALQIVPLPIGLVRVLSPDVADVWSRALSPLHEDGPSLVTLSLDPSATRIQLLRGVFYLSVLLAAMRIAHVREGTQFLERALVFAGAVMAIVALAHPAVGAKRVFGTYAPLDATTFDTRHFAPLLNTNHLAGFLNIGLMVAAAAALQRRGPSMPRALAAGAALLLTGTNLYCASRGGTGALVIGLVVMFVTYQVSHRVDRKNLWVSAGVLTMLLGGGAMAAVYVNDEYIGKMTGGDFSKLRLFTNALELIARAPVFGVGRGAFESAFPAVRHGTDYWVFTNPENIFLQWTTEWGVPVGLGGLGGIAYALLPRAPLGRSLPPIGAWAALVAAFMHNLVDFNAEVPGVMCSLSVCAAICVAGTGGDSKKTPGPISRIAARAPYALAALAAVLGVVCVLQRGTELGTEERALREVALDNPKDKEGFHAAARAAMLRHPADPYLPFVGAIRALTARDESVVPWAGRALDRSPVFGRVHYILARTFLVSSPAQARVEYKTAYVQDSGLRGYIQAESPALVGSYDDALELVPDGAIGLPLLQAIAEAVGPTLPATQIRLDEEMRRRDPLSSAPIEHELRAVLSDIQGHEPWCEANMQACLDEGRVLADRLAGARPAACASWQLRSQMLAASGDHKRAVDDLTAAIDKVDDRTACAKALVELTIAEDQQIKADQAIDRLAKIGCATTPECIDTNVWLANIENGRKHGRKAIFYYQRALDLAPERDDLLESIAAIADRDAYHGDGIIAYGRLEVRHPENPQWTAKKAIHEQAVRDGALVRPTPNP